jgi:hypothetical protein
METVTKNHINEKVFIATTFWTQNALAIKYREGRPWN